MITTSYTCPSCANMTSSRLTRPWLVSCARCSAIVYRNPEISNDITPAKIPFDWSFVQQDSTFDYRGSTFQIVGRIRLQLRNDYKNFWCAANSSGGHIWLMESFASFAILDSTWMEFKQSVNKLHAGGSVSTDKNTKLKGEYVEKCEGVSFAGEIGEWLLCRPGFFFIQCSNNQNQTAVFTIDSTHNIDYLRGEKVGVELLNLKNILSWDEWK